MTFPHSGFEEQLLAGTRLMRRGDYPEAQSAFRALYAQAEAEGNIDLMAASLCEIAWACFKLGEPEQGLECAIGTKLLWRRLGNRGELTRALVVESFLFLDLGFADEAYDLTVDALAMAREVGDPALLGFALNGHGVVLAVVGETDRAVELISGALELGQQAGNPAASAFYALNLGFAHAKLADTHGHQDRADLCAQHYAHAILHSDAAIALAEEASDLWTIRVALCNAAEFLCTQGRFDEARALMARWLDVGGQVNASLRAHYLYTQGLVELAAGEPGAARLVVEEALALSEASNQLDHQVNSAQALARILEAEGDAKAALAMHRHFHKLFVQQSGEAVRRRARVEEIRSETDKMRARLVELADQALSDPLTGIANRRSFDQILNRLAGTPMAVGIVDIDHFKRVNDRYTHITGDAVLQRIARLMVDQLSTHGHVARLGGEEFALIFPDAAEATAIAFCEGIRTAIANADWSGLTPGTGITVSIGVAVGDGTCPAGDLMQKADARLYMAKTLGRNRVVADDIVQDRRAAI